MPGGECLLHSDVAFGNGEALQALANYLPLQIIHLLCLQFKLVSQFLCYVFNLNWYHNSYLKQLFIAFLKIMRYI